MSGREVILALVLGISLSSAGIPAQEGRAQTQAVASRDGLLDINTATPQQLRALPGMGDAYVHRIVEGRPYFAKNQLVTRGVLPQAEYDRIRDLIIAHRVPS